MRVLNYQLEVQCKDSALGEWFEWYDCSDSWEAERIWDRICTNPTAVKAWLCESGKREELFTKPCEV